MIIFLIVVAAILGLFLYSIGAQVVYRIFENDESEGYLFFFALIWPVILFIYLFVCLIRTWPRLLVLKTELWLETRKLKRNQVSSENIYR
jgi:Na+/melibiose symporter-like transporter